MHDIRIGLDVGSTTLKCVVLDARGEIVHEAYERHYAQIREKSAAMLREVMMAFPAAKRPHLCVSGSAGMGLAESLCLPFEQEVYATRTAVKRAIPKADCVIELGGEDAKILFTSGMTEVRMNGSCAGGTGAFIDQMASLLGVTPSELNDLAEQAERTYAIASRCGVFAKSDIQPLLNQGARREDVAASIFLAVVHQTIAGLSQGRRMEGNVVYLGGPLSYFPVLRQGFDEELHVRGIHPQHALYFVAVGAALSALARPVELSDLLNRIESGGPLSDYKHCAPLFGSEADYAGFMSRHIKTGALSPMPSTDSTSAYLGVDAGSTTVKAVAVDAGGAILMQSYLPNTGNPVPVVQKFLMDFYASHPGRVVRGCAATGYGEDLIRAAFHMDTGLVETMAHFIAARAFQPDVDFILDIGGQDIKCFKVRRGAIDNIFLNEACSSGCGSFLQTFAGALGMRIEAFAEKGLYGDKPVDLGSRCTVFMNSSVKQAQKDGASVENISAGLSISVVKNALYKVIRIADADQLGRHIVVQGGTFLNDAVLRAFEQEIGREVVRPSIAGLMGAYGAALFAKSKAKPGAVSRLLSPGALSTFRHEVKTGTCKQCENRCKLTINDFGDSQKYISGNRCERALGEKTTHQAYNLLQEKRALLRQYTPVPGPSGTIGIPLGLNVLEMLPFWYTFFTRLGFQVVTSPESSRELYQLGQHTIPSDTVCYPAKLMHGHIEALLNAQVDAIFYPCMSYNFDEGLGDNHYNCPVVAYYPEVIQANMPELERAVFIGDYVGVHKRRFFPGKMRELLARYGYHFKESAVAAASDAAYEEQDAFRKKIELRGQELLNLGQEKDMPVIILCGRPYHLDAEINHGIDQLITGFGAILITEDAISPGRKKRPTTVLNQWTYHARLYAAAEYVAESPDPKLNLVQLVSFGCGVDAITTDEVRSILEAKGRIYTQIKIDEISNLGAAKIRLRSLFTAVELGNP